MFNAPLLPCALPDAKEVRGQMIALERLAPSRHGPDLWHAIGSTSALWDNVPPGPFAGEGQFTSWLSERSEKQGQAHYALVDGDGRAVGLYLLINIDQAMGRIELGLMLGREISRSTAATEALLLVGRYLFETLGYRRLEWRCNPENEPSIRAAERFGFTFEGVLRQNAWAKGRNWDTAVYSIVDHEWPARAARLLRWLAPDNFDSDGRQRKRLSEMGFAAGD